MKVCPKCSSEFDDKFNFCRNDGTTLQAKAFGTSCPKCGKETEEGKRFCRHCGAKLELQSEAAPKKIEKPQVQEAVSQQQDQSEPSEAVDEPKEKVTEKTERPVIHREEIAQQSVVKHESPTEAAEKHLAEGNYKDAIEALDTFVKDNPEDREARLLHLLASVKLYNIYGYERQTESVKSFSNLTEKERGFAREIFLIRSEEAQRRGREEEAREYQRLANRVILGQPLTELASEAKAEEVPAQRGEVKPFPRKRVEEPVRNASDPAASSSGKISSHVPQVVRGQKKRIRPLFVSLVSIVGFVAVLAGWILGLYAEKQGFSLKTLFRKESPAASSSQPGGGTSPGAVVAQVIGAEELGFKVWGTGATDVNRREALISERIESQLDYLRRFYQQQIQQKPNLMGSIILQLTISPLGQVTKVEEFSSQIKDAEFKRSVIEEVYKWRFPEATLGLVKVNYPLMFLPPGMDVATLVRWEKSIGPRVSETVETQEVTSTTRKAKPPSPPHPVSTSQPPVEAQSATQPQPAARSIVAGPYVVVYPTSVYSQPREDSQRVARIEVGTKVNVVGGQGDWLEVRSKYENPPGFIKKDSAVPMGNR